MGYPKSCPQPADPRDNTVCCRDMQEAKCCNPRAKTICGFKADGNTGIRKARNKVITEYYYGKKCLYNY